VKELNLHDYENQDEDDEYLSYSIQDAAEIPHEEVRNHSFDISGVSLNNVFPASQQQDTSR